MRYLIAVLLLLLAGAVPARAETSVLLHCSGTWSGAANKHGFSPSSKNILIAKDGRWIEMDGARAERHGLHDILWSYDLVVLEQKHDITVFFDTLEIRVMKPDEPYIADYACEPITNPLTE